MQQVWAQVHAHWKSGKSHILPDDAKQMLKEINEDHGQIDPILQMLQEKYVWDHGEKREWKTATQIAKDIELKNVGLRETRLINQYVLNMNGNQKRKVNGRTEVSVPLLAKRGWD